MKRDEMRAFVLRMFRKEKAVCRVWEAQGNRDAHGYLKRAEEADRAFLEAVGHD